MANKKGKGKGRAETFDKVLGAEIRKFRNMAGITQDRIGQKLGITFQQIQKYERGANRISATKLFKLAHILKLDVSHFFSLYLKHLENPESVETNADEHVELTRKDLEMIKAYKALNRDQRNSVKGVVDAIKAGSK